VKPVKRCSISFETLADYYDGRANQTAAERIREHLSVECDHCRENLAWLERAAHTMREVERVQVPHHLVDRLHALYGERFRMPVRRSLLARLSFDSRSMQAFAGARGASEEAFELNYSTDLHDIEIWEEPAGQGNWYLIGQILPREGEDVLQPQQVVLSAEDGTQLSVTPEMPEFHLPAVPAGVYQVTVRFPDSEILIPGFSVGQFAG
jgi:hypothetical protein